MIGLTKPENLMSVFELLQANKEAQERFEAYNAKISEIGKLIKAMDRKGENDSLDYMVACAMQQGLVDARDVDQRRHSKFIEDQSHDWDGD
jgi:cell fate (sporulation/competence/biofilm development) regulator YlbF (YheA/YmcA/DUF963 family)